LVHVEAAGRVLPVRLGLAGTPEVRRLRNWRRTAPQTDATEFATLAAKRWFYYAREGSTAPTLETLRLQIAQNPHREIAFLVCATAA
jgi:hypothetical protein